MSSTTPTIPVAGHCLRHHEQSQRLMYRASFVSTKRSHTHVRVCTAQQRPMTDTLYSRQGVTPAMWQAHSSWNHQTVLSMLLVRVHGWRYAHSAGVRRRISNLPLPWQHESCSPQLGCVSAAAVPMEYVSCLTGGSISSTEKQGESTSLDDSAEDMRFGYLCTGWNSDSRLRQYIWNHDLLYELGTYRYHFILRYSIIPPCTALFEYVLFIRVRIFHPKYVLVLTFYPKYEPSTYFSSKYVLGTYWVQKSWQKYVL